RESINQYLIEQGYVCETAKDLASASEKALIYDYDCIVADITLPDGNSLDLIKKLKTDNINAGIIIISAKTSLEDRIKGLDSGSDDYLPKPFHLSELNARIRSIIRRRKFDGNTEIRFHEILIRPDFREVFVNEQHLTLTAKEYDLLTFFISNKSRVIPKDSIAEHLWGSHIDQVDSMDFIYTHIKNLRKKLIQAGCNDYLKTAYGIGYKFSDNETD
ncbi:MAG: response regulator transcription factor, partial [Cytophagaceae bacterium]